MNQVERPLLQHSLLHRGSAFVLLLRPASSEPATIKLIFLFERAQGLFMRVCISYFASSFFLRNM